MFSIREERKRTAHLTLPMRRARSSHWVIGIDQRDPIDQICNWAATQFQWPCFWHGLYRLSKSFLIWNMQQFGCWGWFLCSANISKNGVCVKYTTAFVTWVRTVAMIWQSRMRSETASIPNGNKWMALCHSLWALLRRKVILRWLSLNQYFIYTLQLGVVTINNIR